MTDEERIKEFVSLCRQAGMHYWRIEKCTALAASKTHADEAFSVSANRYGDYKIDPRVNGVYLHERADTLSAALNAVARQIRKRVLREVDQKPPPVLELDGIKVDDEVTIAEVTVVRGEFKQTCIGGVVERIDAERGRYIVLLDSGRRRYVKRDALKAVA